MQWLHYLADKLIRGKGLKPPVIPAQKSGQLLGKPRTSAANESEREKRCYDNLVEVERALADSVAAVAKRVKAANFKKSRKPRKTNLTGTGPATDVQGSKSCTLSCAGDVLDFGIRKGWVL